MTLVWPFLCLDFQRYFTVELRVRVSGEHHERALQLRARLHAQERRNRRLRPGRETLRRGCST